MAISLTASTIPSLHTQVSARNSLKLSSLSSLQFPLQLRQLRISNATRTSSPSNRRFLPLAEAKKQTSSSLDDLLQNSDKPVLVDFYATWELKPKMLEKLL